MHPQIQFFYRISKIELKYDWTEGRQEVCRLEEELDKDAVCHQFCSTCTANALPRKLWMGLETSFNIGGKIIQTVKYADDLVLRAKEEMVLQGTIDKLIDIGRCYGMEMNVKKQINEISRQSCPATIMIDQKQLENVEYFKYLGSVLTSD